jgi:Na+/H+ antiporter NhaD/arsenite permease-like protein
LAANLTLLRAASNVIIVQAAERRGGYHIGFWRFFAVGGPLAVLNLMVYWIFL